MISEDESRKAFEKWCSINFLIPNEYNRKLFDTALSMSEPRIREDERERLAKLAETAERSHGWYSLTADEIRSGKLED